jgi:6-phospho-beta-glucosidase
MEGKTVKQLKVVVIGGGSSYTPELVEGIILHNRTLPVGELILVDVPMGEEKVKINEALVKRMFQKAELPVKVSYTLNRREALSGADFILTQLRVGGLEARAKDEHIPLKYGVIGQETTGPGGFAKALRTIPVLLDICHDIEKICPEAWLINFTNPSGIVTEAIHKYSKVNCIGLCNVPIGMHYEAAERLGVNPKELYCQFTGLNHLSFMTHAYHQGIDCLPEVLNVNVEDGIVQNIEKIEEMDLIANKLGLMLSPYMQYFYFEKSMIAEETENIHSGKGTRANEVQEVERALFEIYKNKDLDVKPVELSKRGGARYSEAAINLINSIHNDSNEIHVVNVANRGSIPELPHDAVVEINCVINKQGATPLQSGNLPITVKGLVEHVKAYEILTIEAAVTGDKTTALLALMNNPFLHDAKDAKNILEELLEAHKVYLPQFYKES